MRRFYHRVADHLRHFLWGRSLVGHISRHQRLYENVEALFTALVLALLIKAFLFEAYKIPSSSMHNTLVEEDRIFVNKFMYAFWDVKVGDVIVFKTIGIEEIEDPNKPYYIKRVVGLPGDVLQIRNGFIYRNGEKLTKPPLFEDNFYLPSPKDRSTFFQVPEGEVFVFGDNSFNSWDSRAWGGVPLENIMGKAVFRYWPPSRMGLIYGVPPDQAVIERRESEQRDPS